MRIKSVVRVIPSGAWPDSDGERLTYWLSRPASERIEAAREFRRTSFLRLHRHWPARIANIFRPFEF